MRRLARWGWRLALGLLFVAVLCGVAAVLMLDTIARNMLVKRLRAATGMEVKISAVHIGLLSPTVSIEGIKLYNTPDFGGALCLDIPELRFEYDRTALRARRLHLTLLRLDLEELFVVLDKNGRKNFDFGHEKKKDNHTLTQPKDSKELPGQWKFTGIDVMNTTLGTFRMSNLATGQGETIEFSVTNQVLHHVKEWSDLAPLGLTTLSHGKAASSDGSEADLGQWLNRVLKDPSP